MADGNPYAPSDTGAGPARVAAHLTIGFGPSFFVMTGKDRSVSPTSSPPNSRTRPKFPNETMDPAKCGGDIRVQARANDPQGQHAIRNLGPGRGSAPSRRATTARVRPHRRPRAIRPHPETCSAQGRYRQLEADQTDPLTNTRGSPTGTGPPG